MPVDSEKNHLKGWYRIMSGLLLLNTQNHKNNYY